MLQDQRAAVQRWVSTNMIAVHESDHFTLHNCKQPVLSIVDAAVLHSLI